MPNRDVGSILRDFLPWAVATFPESTPRSCVEHLRREVRELIELLDRDRGSARDLAEDVGLEVADCVFLLADLCQRRGIDLVAALEEKLAIVKTRRWGPPDSQGVVEHVREVSHGEA